MWRLQDQLEDRRVEICELEEKVATLESRIEDARSDLMEIASYLTWVTDRDWGDDIGACDSCSCCKICDRHKAEIASDVCPSLFEGSPKGSRE